MTDTTCSMEIRAAGETFSMVDPHKADRDLLYNSMRYSQISAGPFWEPSRSQMEAAFKTAAHLFLVQLDNSSRYAPLLSLIPPRNSSYTMLCHPSPPFHTPQAKCSHRPGPLTGLTTKPPSPPLPPQYRQQTRLAPPPHLPQ